MMLVSDVQKVSDKRMNILHKWLCFYDRIILSLFSLVTRNHFNFCFLSTQAVWVMVSG